MSAKSMKVLKALLWWQACFHVGVGLVGILAKPFAVAVAERFFQFNLELTPQMYWVLNPFAAYMIAFGLVMAVSAMDPARHKAVIYVGCALLALRACQRTFFIMTASADLMASSSFGGNLITIVVVASFAASIFVLARKL